MGRRNRRRNVLESTPAPPLVLPPAPRTTWAEETFIAPHEAETALSEDRQAFLSCRDIMGLIPRKISRHLVHSDPRAQIEGFQELFILLNNDPNAKALRQLIVSYFNNSPPLRGHLSQYSYSIPSDVCTQPFVGYSIA
jgi:hypothetical protein